MNDEIHPQELAGTALAPSDFELLNGRYSFQFAREKGFHPDDEYRDEKHTRHDSQ